MKELKVLSNFFLMLLFVSLRVHSNDAIYCNPGKVIDIQSQTGNIVINISEGVGWKQLGKYSDPALPSRLSMVLAAQASDKNIMLAFSLNSGVVCTEANWNVSPYKVRIFK